MIDYCYKNNLPIDFVSTHSYGVKQGFLDEYGNSGTVLAKEEFAVSGDVLQSRKEIESSPMPNLELHYTEGVHRTRRLILFMIVIIARRMCCKK